MACLSRWTLRSRWCFHHLRKQDHRLRTSSLAPAPGKGTNRRSGIQRESGPDVRFSGRSSDLCLGVHKRRSGKLAATRWVHFGSTKAQTTHKIVLHQVRRAKTNQRDSKSEFNFEPEGREFESLRARHLNRVRPGHMGDTTYLRHR